MKQQKYYNHNYDVGLISDMSEKLNLHPKVIELLFSRGYIELDKIKNFLYPSEKDFLSPFLMSGMNECVNKIKKAVSDDKRILIFGDYDVDGLSATAIMIKMFEKLNKSVNFYLPNRFQDGYGLTNSVIDKINNLYAPELIITVDCGISCYKEVEYAKSLGIDMIITDHHELPEILPDSIIVNPKIKNQAYSFSELCGTGVAFKIAEAVLGHKVAEEFLPIAAIATIADIVSLTGENRAIVYFGLKLFEKFLPEGLKALFSENKLNIKNVSSTDIAFKIAPKLNASGRMGEASESLKLIFAKNKIEIKEQLKKINEYNLKRQVVCNECYLDCIEMLKKYNLSNERAIILSNPKWDHGILGIVAARLVENFNRPTFLFAEDEGVLKGSARSITDINVHEILSSCNDILTTFGGHKMAAGLTLEKNNLNEFIKRVNSFIFLNISSKVFNPIAYYDLDISLSDLDNRFYTDIQKLEPFGLNNHNPLLRISQNEMVIAPIKKFSPHFNINLTNKLNLIYFNCPEKYFDLKYSKDKSFIFELQKERFKGGFKGVVKDFSGSFEFDHSFKSTLDVYYLEQLKYLNFEGQSNYKEYTDEEIINFIADTKGPFGTIFVATRLDTYNDFILKYSSENIYKKIVFNNFVFDGFNAVSIYPTNITMFKDYSKIIFLDPVLDKGYLNKIYNISNAEIYIPSEKTFDKSIFKNIDIRRDAIGAFYNFLKNYKNVAFLNELDAYNKINRSFKCSFKNFHIYLMILNEIGVITINEIDSFTIYLNEKVKSELKKSKIYNFLNLMFNINKSERI